MSWGVGVRGLQGNGGVRGFCCKLGSRLFTNCIMEGDRLAEYNGLNSVTRNCLHVCFGEGMWSWPWQPLRKHSQSVLQPPPQLEILFNDSPLPNPIGILTDFLPAYSKTAVPEFLSAEPTCTLLQTGKGFHVTGRAGEEFFANVFLISLLDTKVRAFVFREFRDWGSEGLRTVFLLLHFWGQCHCGTCGTHVP